MHSSVRREARNTFAGAQTPSDAKGMSAVRVRARRVRIRSFRTIPSALPPSGRSQLASTGSSPSIRIERVQM